MEIVGGLSGIWLLELALCSNKTSILIPFLRSLCFKHPDSPRQIGTGWISHKQFFEFLTF